MLKRIANYLIKRPLIVLLTWIVVIVLFSIFAVNVSDRLSGDLTPPNDSEAMNVQRVIQEEFPELDTEQLMLTVSYERYSIGDEAFEREVDYVLQEIEQLDQVQAIKTYRDEGLEAFGNTGDDTGIIVIGLDSMEIEESQQVVTTMRELIQTLETPLETNVTGMPAVANDLSDESEKDVGRSGKIALPFTIVLLIVAFGSLLAAVIPPIIGWFSLVITLGIIAWLSQFMSIHALAQTVVAMLGLAAGIDYTLLMVSRFREELNKGKTIDEAIIETVKNAGRTVLFSGTIVVLSLVALLFPPLTMIRSIGLAGMIVIFITMLTATTLVPVLLKLFGTHFKKSNSSKKEALRGDDSVWAKWGKWVIQHRSMLTVLSTLLLIVMALPIFSIKIHNDGVDNLADTVESKKGVLMLEEKDLAGTLDRIDILIKTENPIDENVHLLTKDLEKLDVKLVLSPTPSEIPLSQLETVYEHDTEEAEFAQLISDDKEHILIRVVPTEPLDVESMEEMIDHVTETVERRFAEEEVMYGGNPLVFKEFDDALYKSFPLAISIVLLLTFILLTVVFRSIYMSTIAIISNILILSASMGMVVFYFQDYLNMMSLHPMVPIIVFAIIFGLSMDYQVFLLSRIKEERVKGANVQESIVKGMTSTSRIITYAGLIMAVVFCAFILSDVMTVKMLGFGLAVAIILDITVARLMLMPALLSFQRNK